MNSSPSGGTFMHFTEPSFHPTDVQFGHAGASAGGEAETATSKNKALSEAGATVPASFNEFGKKIGEVYQDLVKKGVIVPQPEVGSNKFLQN